jgi:hypothetical protein
MNAHAKNRTRLVRGAAVLVALAALAFAPASARANFEFTASGTSSDGPLNAEAYFVVGNGTITLYVANLTSGTQSQGDAISGITFSVSAPPNTSLSLQSPGTAVAGNVVNVTSGTFSSPTYTPFTASGGVAANWAVQTNNNVTDIGNPSNPHYLIVGPNASFSGQGNPGGNFNPYFQSLATSPENLSTAPPGDSVMFVLSAPGVTSSSTISNVVFNFGTSPNEHTANGSPVITTAVPAPSSVVLLGVGFLCFLGYAGYTRRRRLIAAT